MENPIKTKDQILIKKASGEVEAFSTQKLAHSLTKAGAKTETVSRIVSNIESSIYPGITTKKIYERAFNLLRLEQGDCSLRYRLKQAIFDLGPTGYPFEVLVGEIFKHQGYKTEVGVVVAGHCVTHEMDVIATNKTVQHLVECKYHKDQGHQVSVQVPLYVHSRIEDIVKQRAPLPEFYGYHFESWIFTNTRYTPDATKYGVCSGIHLVGWNFPESNGLKELIERYKIYPLTILNNLSLKEKQYLLEKGIVTCTQLSARIELLHELNISKKKFRALELELRSACL
jgi:hypothetical protein